MQPDNKIKLLKYLEDALNAAEEIELLSSGLPVQNFDVANVKWVIERGIEIVSEALKRATVLEPHLPVTDLSKIFATRNKIAHEYDIVDKYLLFTIARKNIPILIKELKAYIELLETS